MNIFVPLALLSAYLVVALAQTDAEKAHVMCIIETQLSTTACKDTAKSEAGRNDATTACRTLETFKDILSVIGCNQNDYDILHKVLCDRVHVDCTPAA